MQLAASGRFHNFLIYAKNLNIGQLLMPLGKFLFLFQKISKEQHYGKLSFDRLVGNFIVTFSIERQETKNLASYK